MTSFNKYNEDSIRFRAVVNLAAKKEDDSSNKKINQLQRKWQRRKDLSLPLKQRRILQISQEMKIMNQLLKSKKLLQNLPNRIIMAAMTIKVQIKRVCS